MPGFADIQNEIQSERPPAPVHNTVRKRHLERLCKKTGRNALLYYSGWLQKPLPSLHAFMRINNDDKNGLMGAVMGMDVSKGLDVVLHTPGGDLAATESLVDYLYQKFGGDIRAIVPHMAMSGGTIIACACKEIIMGKQSSLGPIDPQIRGTPASSIISEFNAMKREMEGGAAKSEVWRHMAANYSPGMLDVCKNAVSLSESLARKFLSASMFKDDLRDDRARAEKTIDRIIRALTDPSVTKSHFRQMSIPMLKDSGLKVSAMEDDDALQDIALSIHHASVLSIRNTRAVKIIESQLGQTYAVTYGGGGG